MKTVYLRAAPERRDEALALAESLGYTWVYEGVRYWKTAGPVVIYLDRIVEQEAVSADDDEGTVITPAVFSADLHMNVYGPSDEEVEALTAAGFVIPLPENPVNKLAGS